MSFSIRKHHRVLVAVLVVLGLLLAFAPTHVTFAQQDWLSCRLAEWLPLKINKSACVDTLDLQSQANRILKEAAVQPEMYSKRLSQFLERFTIDLSELWNRLNGVEKVGLPRYGFSPDAL
jgi:hypothetical protein